MTAHPEASESLATFSALAPQSPLGIPHHAFFPGSGTRREHLVLGFVTHGNEYGSLPAATRLLQELRDGVLRPAGPTSLVLGNVEAVRNDVRFIEEDYNRVFTFDRSPDTLERRRAAEVRPLLDQADFFLDIHQTQTKTESAFWTFPWDEELASWARLIAAAPRGLTRVPDGAFAQGKRCLDEYVRDRGKVGLTVELGEKGADPAQAEACYRACVRLLEGYDRVKAGASLSELSARQPEINWFETVEVVVAETPEYRLREGLQCWTEVPEGQLLSAEGAPQIVARVAGRVLFPKYPPPGQPPPRELLRIAQPLPNPSTRFQTT